MRKIFIIGTLHAGLTPTHELQTSLNHINPDQLFVEIKDDDIKKNHLGEYPPEMISAYKWGLNKGIQVNGYDSSINVFRNNKSQNDNQKVIEQQKKLLKNYSWKDMNKASNSQLLNTPEYTELIDEQKEQEREFHMLQCIEQNLADKDVVLIVTGVGHLSFFEKNLQGAIFPYR